MDIASLGFRTDLMIRRLAGSRIHDGGDWLLVSTPSNPTFWWGNFLLWRRPLRSGDAATGDALFAAEFPDSEHRAYGVDGTRGKVGDEAELACLRGRVDVNSVLTATRLREPARPTAICRELNGDDDWRQAAELRLACHDRPDTEQQEVFGHRHLKESQSLVEHGHGAWFGAFVDGTMVSGLGIFSDHSGLARYQNVETRPAYRRRGLAARLVYLAAEYARAQLDAHTIVIVADPSSEAIRLYRSLGFVDAEQQVQIYGAEHSAHSD
jgi:ribosomal protein S18 acetylase RimI-like enzyme